ncbi:MAG: sugar ABC transporter permease [Chloroflexota bacterium]|nr:sugar ABC transporter permease [Chloroflexota bacterium]
MLYEGVMVLYPMAQGVATSLTRTGTGAGEGRFVGLANYQRMLGDRTFWTVVTNTFEYTALVVTLALAAGLGMALLMNTAFRGRTVVRGLMTTPWAFPDVPTAIVFVWMLNPTFGVMNLFARMLPWVQDSPPWLLDVHLALATVVAMTVWKGFPFYSLVLLAALQGVPAELYEAARVDGAHAWDRFRHVTFPHVVPTLLLLAILAFIFSFQQFTLIWLTTGGGPVRATETLVLLIYEQAFRFYDYSYAAGLGVIGLVLAVCAAVLFLVVERRATGQVV